jgi:nitric oxide reductase activation protein
MRRSVRFLRGSLAFIVLSLLLFFLPIQSPARLQGSGLPSDQLPTAGPPGPMTPEQEHIEHDRAKRINKERFDNLKRDTDKLLELATELKQNVDRANENTLSVDVIKKADEIDKLAKQIREKMKGQ